MITLIYPFRNREIDRIKRSLESLVTQTNSDFNVIFIDYGSKIETSDAVQNLLKNFNFVSYEYLYTEYQPWNKSKAVNYALKKINTDYFFVSDVDMIYSQDFIEIAHKIKDLSKVTYFQVGFLSEFESNKNILFNECKINFFSDEGATGMSIFPTKVVKRVNGFDEFFHFWGSEDTDLHNRLKILGISIVFYSEKTLMLHQWHKNYRKRETKKLNLELQLSQTVEMNQLHMFYNLDNNVTKVNIAKYGEVISQTEFEKLKNHQTIQLSDEKSKIDYFLFNQLPNSHNEIIAVRICKNKIQNNIKHKLKKLLRKKVPQFYSLKEINDLFLKHIVSFYHQLPYLYYISSDLETIYFKIQK